MIKHRRASRCRELSEPNQRRPACGFRRAAAPDSIMHSQPGKEIVVLRGREVARQRLIEMMVGVYKAGEHDLSGEIEHQISRLRKLVRATHLFDESVAGEQ